MPWIPLVAAGVTALGSYLAAKKASQAGRQSGTERDVQQQLLEKPRAGSPLGLQFLAGAQQNLGAASDFSNSLLRGGYDNALSLLSPELSANARATQGALASSMRQSPRASGTGSQRLGLMDSMQASRNNALLSLRPSAAQMLSSIGSTQGSLGSGLLSGSNSGSLGLLGYGLKQRMGQFDMSRQAIQGLLGSMQGIDWQGMFGGGQQRQTLPVTDLSGSPGPKMTDRESG